MPKSKRAKKVSLTQTRKKGLELKQKTIEEIKENVDKYSRIFVFSVQNMRNTKLKGLRAEWKHSRFYLGKNKVVGLALGRSAEDEYRDSLHRVSRRLFGQMGLLFTDKTQEEVVKFFSSYSEPDFARLGTVVTQTVIVDQGPLPQFSHALEPQLRQLGLPTCLQRGVVTLRSDYTICQKGEVLNPEQARILKLFGHMLADFYVTIDSMWQRDGSFEVLRHEKPVVASATATTVRIRPRQRVEGQDDVSDADLGFEVVPVEEGEHTQSADVTDEVMNGDNSESDDSEGDGY